MEILQLDADNLSESFGKNRQHYHETSGSSLDFEEITSFDGSVDSGRIKSFKMSPHCSDELTQTIRPQKREETYMEKIHDFGTNLKYNFELLSQSFWMKDEPEKTKVYMLGKEYSVSHPNNRENTEQDQTVEKVFSEIIWFTYRKNFPKLNYREVSSDESYVSDTGWGCMIRASQMILGETLRKILNEESLEEVNKENGKKYYSQNKERTGRTNRQLRNDEKQRGQRNTKKVISWFLDCETNPSSAPYSIQNICTTLYQRFNLKPGNWFKASSVLFSLQSIHESYANYTQPNLKIEIFPEGTIYISQALKKVTNPGINKNASLLDFEKGFEVIEEEEDEICLASSLKLADNINQGNTDSIKTLQENGDNTATATDIDNLLKLKWHSSLLLFVMAKIGLDKPNPEYIPFIKELLSYPESIGMIGGKPGLASYIVGCMEDKLMLLDPHFVHESVQSKKDLKEHLNTYHCKTIKYISFNEIDTSVAFGFLIRNENEFQDFIQRFKLSCEKKESFLAVVDNPPQEDVLEVENFDEEGEFEMISIK